MNFTMKLPGLEEVLVQKMETISEEVRLHVEMPVKTNCCPSCQTKTRKIHDYRIQKIKHLKVFERFTDHFLP